MDTRAHLRRSPSKPRACHWNVQLRRALQTDRRRHAHAVHGRTVAHGEASGAAHAQRTPREADAPRILEPGSHDAHPWLKNEGATESESLIIS